MDAAVLAATFGGTFVIALGIARLVLGLLLSSFMRRD